MRRPNYSVIVAVLCFTPFCLGNPPSQADDAKGEWKELFNGEDLTGWKVSENKDAIYVEGGSLVTNGKRAHAFYVGDEDGSEIYKNFRLRAEAKTEPSANSGIYFHTRYLDKGWPDRGYEAQVNNTHGDPKKTGGLYSVQDNFKAPVKDGEWFNYVIVVKGKHIKIKINGETVSDYTEPDDLDRPERQLSDEGGLIALQAHDPGSKVSYRSIKIRRLSDDAE